MKKGKKNRIDFVKLNDNFFKNVEFIKFEDLLDRRFGPRGTEEREKFEQEVLKEILREKAKQRRRKKIGIEDFFKN